MITINFFKARKQLLLLWLIGGGLLCLIFIFQLSASRYDGIFTEALGWFLPNIIPILSIMFAGFFGDMNRSQNQILVEIPKSYFSIACYISIGYLLLFLWIIFSFNGSKGNIIDYYNKWSTFLGPVQGLASYGVAAFFLKQKSTLPRNRKKENGSI